MPKPAPQHLPNDEAHRRHGVQMATTAAFPLSAITVHVMSSTETPLSGSCELDHLRGTSSLSRHHAARDERARQSDSLILVFSRVGFAMATTAARPICALPTRKLLQHIASQYQEHCLRSNSSVGKHSGQRISRQPTILRQQGCAVLVRGR